VSELLLAAFSDYHAQSLQELKASIQKLQVKPDLILYGGDAVRRFGPYAESTRHELLHRYIKKMQTGDDFIIEVPQVEIKEKGRLVPARVPDLFLFRMRRARGGYAEEQLIHEFSEKVVTEVKRLMTLQTSERLRQDTDLPSFLRDIAGRFNKDPLEISEAEINRFLHQDCTLQLVENAEWVWGSIHILGETGLTNQFSKLADLSQLGVCGVIGNSDVLPCKSVFRAKRVYDVHERPFFFGDYAVIGQEGGSAPEGHLGLGCTCYKEETITSHLEELWTLVPRNRKIILLTHTPPYGVLDHSVRYGEAHIGSQAVAEFIRDKRNIALIVCGHSHYSGGKVVELEGVPVVNVASQDDNFSPAIFATVKLNGSWKVEFCSVPSNFELLMSDPALTVEDRKQTLKEWVFYDRDAEYIVDAHKRYGESFLRDFHELYRIKNQFGFSFPNVIEFYNLGVRSKDDFSEEILREVVKRTSRRGLAQLVLRRAFLKLQASRAGKPMVYGDLSHLAYDKIAFLDIEYLPELKDKPAVYGFLVQDTVRQFIMGEEHEMKTYLKQLLEEGYKLFFYGGADKKILRNLMRHNSVVSSLREANGKFVNVLYHIQCNIGLPIYSQRLSEVFQFLYPDKAPSEWEYAFSNGSRLRSQGLMPYEMDGSLKAMLIRQILGRREKGEATEEYFQLLKKANATDLYELKLVLQGIRNLSETTRFSLRHLCQSECRKEANQP